MSDLDLADIAGGQAVLKKKRLLNVRLAAGSLIVIAFLGLAAFALIQIQVRQLTKSLVIDAGEMQRRGHFADAAKCLAQLLELRPTSRHNPTIRVLLAEVSDSAGGDRDARRHIIELYREALKTAPADDIVYMLGRLGELLCDVGEFEEAKQPARDLLKLDQNSRKAWRVLALANYELFRAGLLTAADKDSQSAAEAEIRAQAGRPATVGITLRHAHRLDPGNIPVAERLAEVYRGEGPWLPAALGAAAGEKGPDGKAISSAEQRATAADGVIAELVAARPKDAAAQLALFRYLMDYKIRSPKDKPGADKALKQARQAIADAMAYRPDQPAVLLVAGDLARWEAKAAAGAKATGEARRHRKEARKYYERAIGLIAGGARGDVESAYFALSETLNADGNTPAALDCLRRGFAHCDNRSVFLALGRVEVLMGRGDDGDLREVDKVLSVVDDLLRHTQPVVRLRYQPLADMWRASWLVRQGKTAEAQPLLTGLTEAPKANQRAGDDRPPLVPLKIVYQAWLLLGITHADGKQWDQALAAFDAAAARDRTAVAPCLRAAAVCIDAGRPAKAVKYYQQALAALDAGRDPPEGQRHFVYTRLIELLEQEKRRPEADRYRALRDDLTARSAALTRQEVEAAILAEKPAEATALAERGVRSRPQDPWAHLALGRACRASHAPAKAEAAYQKAVQRAHGDVAVVMDLANFLIEHRDPLDRLTAEAALGGVVAQSADVGLKLVELLTDRGQADDALAAAQRSLQSHPQDPLAGIALGKAWWANRDLVQAEAAFKDAVRLAGTSTRPIRSLFNFYAATGQADEARVTLEHIPLGPGATGVEQALFLADGYAGLGFPQLAKPAYQRAVEAAGDNPAVVLRQTEFLLQSNDAVDVAEGEKQLRGIAAGYPPARRALVARLLARSDETSWEEARRLLDSAPRDVAARQDRLKLAQVLLNRGGNKNLAQAAGICRAMLAEGRDLAPEIHLALARICDVRNQPDDARREYHARVDNDASLNLQIMAQFSEFLVRRGPPAEADAWLKKLEALAPDAVEVVELRAGWLRREKRDAEIEPLVEAFAQKLLKPIAAENRAQTAHACEVVSYLYRRIGAYPAAERWARRVVAASPERFKQLALALIAQGRVAEAIAVCSDAAEHDKSSQPIMLITRALLCGKATAADMERVDSLLRKAIRNPQTHPDLVSNVLLARSVFLPQEADQQIARYRQALERWPQHDGLLNNLASLLVERSEPRLLKEALDCIDRSIQSAGRLPRLLDTKGMVLISAGKPEEAVALFKEALAVPQPEPSSFFHLALACDRLGRHEQARAALDDAGKANLNRQMLPPRERTLLAELEKKLAP